MLDKPKMAYLMHVNWDWIKQRPHFLYEELTRYYNVDLFYIDKLYDSHQNKNLNSRNSYSDSNVITLTKLPLSGRYRTLQGLEKLINRKALNSLEKYDYIWVTSPIILDFLFLERLKEKTVIYDCMDDFLSFYRDVDVVSRLRELEVHLIQRADVIFTSSSYLRDKIMSSYHAYISEPPYLVNNGLSDTFLQRNETKYIKKIEKLTPPNDMLNLMYIGTIGGWIDFELILSILHQIPNIMVTMIGPIDTKVPQHSRLNYLGVMGHDKIPYYAEQADALIMPFILNELVRAVDPVKIYEYIHFNKPIIAIHYGEMDKFLPYVKLYNNEAEFLTIVRNLHEYNKKSYTAEDRLSFLMRSTWSERCKQIVRVLEGEPL
ncbi:MAG: hypothetical protein ACQEXX_29130 [Bacillota bacterium]